MLGTRVSVRFNDRVVQPELERLLSPFVTAELAPVRSRHVLSVVGHSQAGSYDLYQDCRRVAAGVGDSALFGAILGVLNREVVESAPWFSVHAGVVSTSAGTMAFPAGSGRGKSTLVAACLVSGIGYVSDEALVLDDHGTVLPYPKPLSLSAASRALLGLETGGESRPGEELYTAEDLGSAVEFNPPQLTDIVLAEFGALASELVEVPRSNAWSALLARSFNHYRFPQKAFELAAAVTKSSRVWELRYSTPAEAVRLLGEGPLSRTDHAE